jgi:hypothetical protein
VSVEVSNAMEATADERTGRFSTDLVMMLWMCLVALIGLAGVLTMVG